MTDIQWEVARGRASTRAMRVTDQAGWEGGHVTDPFQWFLGIDWGQETHQFCLINAQGTVADERRVSHTTAAVHEALRQICDRTGVGPTAIAVAIELTHGVLVDTLLDYGFRVFALNPKQLDRFRDRFTPAGAKDDRRDARAAADGLRTDAPAFRAVHPDHPAMVPLRELTRLLDELQTQQGRLTNQLRDQLYRVHAAWLDLSPAATDPWLWTLLHDHPHPHAWAQIPRRRLATVLRAHRVRRVTPEAVFATLRQPRLPAAPGVAEAVALRIGALIPQLELVHAQVRQAEHQIDRLLAALAEPAAPGQPREHRDVEILRSLPGVGRVVTATMLAEASGPLAARDYVTLRTYSGTAPVTQRSGKRLLHVQMRYACKARLREALYHWSRTSIQHDAPARAYYERLRGRGHSHGRALRSVADRWLRILVAMLRSRSLYDVAQLTKTASEAV